MEGKLTSIFWDLPDAVILYQADGSIYDCNEAACNLFKYSRLEMKSLKHADLLPENLSKRMPAELVHEIPTNNEFLWVIRRHKDGTIFECEHNSKIVCLEGIEFCLSCYRRAESTVIEHLNVTEDLDTNLPRSSTTAIFTWQEVEGTLYLIGYNPGMEESTQGKIREYVGATAHDLYEFRGRTDLIESMYNVYRKKSMFHNETYCDFLITDNYRFVDIVSFYVEPNLLVQFIEDVTDRHRALSALKESEERFKALYIGTPIPVITWKYQGGEFILVACNTAMESFTEGRIAGFIGTTAGRFYYQNPELCNDIRLCFKEQTIVQRESAMKFFNEEKYLTFTNAYVPGDLVLTHINDITDEKRAEAELLNYQHELSNLFEKNLNILESERTRISQELHDGIGQYLSTIKFSIENMLLTNGSTLDSYSIQEQLHTNISLLKEAIKDVSKISMDLRPAILDDLGLIATINWFLREFSKVYKSISVKTHVSANESDIPKQIKIVIYRVLQEAMNNITRHSSANIVDILMWKTDENLEFAIEDNGKGFDVHEMLRNRCGLGIAGMRERVTYSKGNFSIESIKGRGTSIQIAWPISH